MYLSPPRMSQQDREMLLEAFDSNWIAPQGPHLEAFEAEFAAKLNVPHAVAVSSGTAALHLALSALDICEGDRVATSTLTFVASANAIKYVGATPVFIDSESRTWNLDPDLLAEEMESGIRNNTPIRAVLAVDIFGQCADYEPIRKICQFYEVQLIEDAAEALGASYQGRPAGTHGDIGCFSFNGNKIITTSGGGMLVTHRKEWVDRIRYLATQARTPARHYEHHEVGFNYRLSNLLAAVGRSQLRLLDERVDQRRALFGRYRDALGSLPGLRFMPEHSAGCSSRWLTCLTIDPAEFGGTRDDVISVLEADNIEARPLWKPMHLQPLFADCVVRGGAVSKSLFEKGLCLPSGSELTSEEVQRILDATAAMGGHSLLADDPTHVSSGR